MLECLFVCAHARTECCSYICVLGVFVCEDGTADGFEYTGSWKNDEMDGEFMTCFIFGMKDDKVPMRRHFYLRSLKNLSLNILPSVPVKILTWSVD